MLSFVSFGFFDRSCCYKFNFVSLVVRHYSVGLGDDLTLVYSLSSLNLKSYDGIPLWEDEDRSLHVHCGSNFDLRRIKK